MSTEFTPGQEVYDIRGRVGSYVGPSQHGHVVEPLYESDDDDSHYGDAQTWPEVFATAPRERLAAELADLLGEINEGQAKLRAVQAEVHAAEQVKRDVLRRAKTEPQLADLHLWLEGKATHIVALDTYSVEIGTVKEVLMTNDRDRSLRLLSLYVDPKENSYRVQRASYSDGSGHNFTTCRLASSEEHAKEVAREYIAQQLVSGHQQHSRDTWICWAIQFDVPVTDAQRQFLADREAESATKHLEYARQTHQRAVEALRDAEAAYGAKAQAQPVT
jgi:hypothetical protein